MFTRFLILSALFCLCCGLNGDEVDVVDGAVSSRKKKYFYPGLFYLTFLALKAKIVLLIGAVITAMVFFGKIFAFLKYGSIFFNKQCENNKVYVEHPYHDHYGGPPVHFDHPEFVDHPPHHERSFKDTMMDNIKYVKDAVKSFDITEMAFNQMNVTRDACKRKFVCDVDARANKNFLFGFASYLFSDSGMEKYRSRSLKECADYQRECNNA